MNKGATAIGQQLTVGTTAVQISGAADNRIGVIFSAPAGGRMTFAFGQIPSIDGGLTLNQGDQPIKLNEDEYG